jgi:hypothetical protein
MCGDAAATAETNPVRTHPAAAVSVVCRACRHDASVLRDRREQHEYDRDLAGQRRRGRQDGGRLSLGDTMEEWNAVCNQRQPSTRNLLQCQKPNRELTGVVARTILRPVFPVPRWLAVLASIPVAACAVLAPAAASDPSSADRCTLRVIISFTPEMQRAPDDRVLTELGRAADAELTFVSTIAPNLHVFNLSAAGGESACHDALERLRHDSHIRSADIDARRKHH